MWKVNLCDINNLIIIGIVKLDNDLRFGIIVSASPSAFGRWREFICVFIITAHSNIIQHDWLLQHILNGTQVFG